MSSYTRNWKKICGKDASGTGMSKKRDVRKQERRIGLKGAPVRCFRTDSGSGETRDTSGTSGAAGRGIEMNLSEEGLKKKEEWESRGYELPKFDRAAMIKATGENPVWVHFGAGNIFRAFHAEIAQRMLDKKETGRGIIVAEGYDYEIVEKQYRPHDNLSILVTLCADGNIKKTVIGSIAESCILDSNDEEEYSRLKEVFTKESLQLCTFTITEKGYSLMDAKGELLPAVLSDFDAGPEKPQSYLGKVVSLLYARFRAGEKPIAMVSTDNCSRNGEKLEKAVSTFADEWVKRGCVEAGFAAYVKDESKVSFPWSMIDKITPRPDASVEEMLEKDGLAECTPVFTAKKTCIAPFVNAEETEYLVIEDKFPNGRPKLEKGGVLFTDRATVQKIEQMKVQTCLNPLHTLLAVFGCLLGYTRISKEMQDEDLSKAVRILGYKEGLPVVVNPGILDPKKFIDTVVNVRIPLSAMERRSGATWRRRRQHAAAGQRMLGTSMPQFPKIIKQR